MKIPEIHEASKVLLCQVTPCRQKAGLSLPAGKQQCATDDACPVYQPSSDVFTELRNPYNEQNIRCFKVTISCFSRPAKEVKARKEDMLCPPLQ